MVYQIKSNVHLLYSFIYAFIYNSITNCFGKSFATPLAKAFRKTSILEKFLTFLTYSNSLSLIILAIKLNFKQGRMISYVE